MPARDVILIPWRGGERHREMNLPFVVKWYEPLGLPVFFGDDGSHPFNRGASRNDAARKAGDWDVALISDADCVVPLDIIPVAMEMARRTGMMILPHDDFYRLTRSGTQRLLQDPSQEITIRTLQRLCGYHWGRPTAPSGALLISRKSFEKIGGYDPGFVGWGYEDSAFLNDAHRIVGVERLPGPIAHLWHPRDGAGPEPSPDLAKRHARA